MADARTFFFFSYAAATPQWLVEARHIVPLALSINHVEEPWPGSPTIHCLSLARGAILASTCASTRTAMIWLAPAALVESMASTLACRSPTVGGEHEDREELQRPLPGNGRLRGRVRNRLEVVEHKLCPEVEGTLRGGKQHAPAQKATGQDRHGGA